MTLSGGYNSPLSEEEGKAIIKHAFNQGITFFDTSDIYGPHTNEILIGKASANCFTNLLDDMIFLINGSLFREMKEIWYFQALKELPREEIQLATKFGIVSMFGDGGMKVNGTPGYVRACCEASLQRLQVDCIDLYYQHRIDQTVPIEETVSLSYFVCVCISSTRITHDHNCVCVCVFVYQARELLMIIISMFIIMVL